MKVTPQKDETYSDHHKPNDDYRLIFDDLEPQNPLEDPLTGAIRNIQLRYMHENYYQNQEKKVFSRYRYEEHQEMNNSMLFYPNNYSNFSHDKNR